MDSSAGASASASASASAGASVDGSMSTPSFSHSSTPERYHRHHRDHGTSGRLHRTLETPQMPPPAYSPRAPNSIVGGDSLGLPSLTPGDRIVGPSPAPSSSPYPSVPKDAFAGPSYAATQRRQRRRHQNVICACIVFVFVLAFVAIPVGFIASHFANLSHPSPPPPPPPPPSPPPASSFSAPAPHVEPAFPGSPPYI